MSHAQVFSGGFIPGTFGFFICDRDSQTLDDLLVGAATPGLTDTAYVYVTGTRWSCMPAEAIAFCNLATRLLNNISAADVPSCEQAIWWQDDPNFWHYLLVNSGGAGIREDGSHGGRGRRFSPRVHGGHLQLPGGVLSVGQRHQP
ncbi:MAG: hypothetical protein IT161_11690 [Bryobacterales bacterium]|nr:hypothetical protein [Bryobacterales bacterium]